MRHKYSADEDRARAKGATAALEIWTGVKTKPVHAVSEGSGHHYRILEPSERLRFDGVVEKQVVAQVLRMPGMPKRMGH